MKNVWILVVIYLNFFLGCAEFTCEMYYRKSEFITGVVERKFIDAKDRSDCKINILRKGKPKGYGFVMPYHDTLGLYKALQVGDSIAKDSGSLVFRIYHFDTIWVDLATNKVTYDTIFTTYDAAKDCERLEGDR